MEKFRFITSDKDVMKSFYECDADILIDIDEALDQELELEIYLYRHEDGDVTGEANLVASEYRTCAGRFFEALGSDNIVEWFQQEGIPIVWEAL